MSYTSDLAQVVDRLRTDAQLQSTYRTDPTAAAQGYGLTPHERDAFVTADLDDFVAIGLVWSIWNLPEVMTGPRPGGIAGIRLAIELELRQRLHLPPPDDRFTPPRPLPPRAPAPMPLPEPPRPRPRPGPDPPPPTPGPGPGG